MPLILNKELFSLSWLSDPVAWNLLSSQLTLSANSARAAQKSDSRSEQWAEADASNIKNRKLRRDPPGVGDEIWAHQSVQISHLFLTFSVSHDDSSPDPSRCEGVRRASALAFSSALAGRNLWESRRPFGPEIVATTPLLSSRLHSAPWRKLSWMKIQIFIALA